MNYSSGCTVQYVARNQVGGSSIDNSRSVRQFNQFLNLAGYGSLIVQYSNRDITRTACLYPTGKRTARARGKKKKKVQTVKKLYSKSSHIGKNKLVPNRRLSRRATIERYSPLSSHCQGEKMPTQDCIGNSIPAKRLRLTIGEMIEAGFKHNLLLE